LNEALGCPPGAQCMRTGRTYPDFKNIKDRNCFVWQNVMFKIKNTVKNPVTARSRTGQQSISSKAQLLLNIDKFYFKI
jgi:hypothetical protein